MPAWSVHLWAGCVFCVLKLSSELCTEEVPGGPSDAIKCVKRREESARPHMKLRPLPGSSRHVLWPFCSDPGCRMAVFFNVFCACDTDALEEGVWGGWRV